MLSMVLKGFERDVRECILILARAHCESEALYHLFKNTMRLNQPPYSLALHIEAHHSVEHKREVCCGVWGVSSILAYLSAS